MRLKIVSCEVFCREFRHFAAGSEHIIDIAFQPFGLHDTPDKLRESTQAEIDRTPEGRYDYILIGYGLCSRGTAGVTARHTPLVIPRAHDCITMFLGSKERYAKKFSESPGTYYFSSGWIERKDGLTEQGNVRIVKEEERKRRFQEYVEKYGLDNAQYLIQIETEWLNNYRCAAFISLRIGHEETYRTFTKNVAHARGWDYEEIQGNTGLIQRFLDGNWSAEEFLVVPPGYRIVQTYDNNIVGVEGAASIGEGELTATEGVLERGK